MLVSFPVKQFRSSSLSSQSWTPSQIHFNGMHLFPPSHLYRLFAQAPVICTNKKRLIEVRTQGQKVEQTFFWNSSTKKVDRQDVASFLTCCKLVPEEISICFLNLQEWDYKIHLGRKLKARTNGSIGWLHPDRRRSFWNFWELIYIQHYLIHKIYLFQDFLYIVCS